MNKEKPRARAKSERPILRANRNQLDFSNSAATPPVFDRKGKGKATDDGLPLQGCFICITECKNDKRELRITAEKLGAASAASLVGATTHLIADRAGSPKFEMAVAQKMKIMLPSWIYALRKAVAKSSQSENPTPFDFDVLEAEHTMPFFYNLRICIFQIPKQGKAPLKHFLESHGASVTVIPTPSTTHILLHPATANGACHLLPPGNKAHLLWCDWAEDVAHTGGLTNQSLQRWAWSETVDAPPHASTSAGPQANKSDLRRVITVPAVYTHPLHLQHKSISSSTPDRPSVPPAATNKEAPLFEGYRFMLWLDRSDPKTKIVKKAIVDRGGSVLSDKDIASTSADFIIAPYFIRNEKEDYRIVTVAWIERCLAEEMMVAPSWDRILERPLPYSVPLPDAHKLKVVLTGFGDSPEGEFAERFVTAIGGRCYSKLSRSRTHLIRGTLPDDEAREKAVEKATEWGIPIVTVQWLREWAADNAGVPLRRDEQPFIAVEETAVAATRSREPSPIPVANVGFPIYADPTSANFDGPPPAVVDPYHSAHPYPAPFLFSSDETFGVPYPESEPSIFIPGGDGSDSQLSAGEIQLGSEPAFMDDLGGEEYHYDETPNEEEGEVVMGEETQFDVGGGEEEMMLGGEGDSFRDRAADDEFFEEQRKKDPYKLPWAMGASIEVGEEEVQPADELGGPDEDVSRGEATECAAEDQADQEVSENTYQPAPFHFTRKRASSASEAPPPPQQPSPPSSLRRQTRRTSSDKAYSSDPVAELPASLPTARITLLRKQTSDLLAELEAEPLAESLPTKRRTRSTRAKRAITIPPDPAPPLPSAVHPKRRRLVPGAGFAFSQFSQTDENLNMITFRDAAAEQAQRRIVAALKGQDPPTEEDSSPPRLGTSRAPSPPQPEPLLQRSIAVSDSVRKRKGKGKAPLETIVLSDNDSPAKRRRTSRTKKT